MTTKELIGILPFENKFKEDLLNKFDKLDVEEVYLLEKVLWGMYDIFFEMMLQENLELGMQHATQGQEKLDSDFYNRIKELTEQQVNNAGLEKISQLDLLTARNALESILREETQN